MDEVRKKCLANNCTETVHEKLPAVYLWSDRAHEAQEVVFLMVSSCALSVTTWHKSSKIWER